MFRTYDVYIQVEGPGRVPRIETTTVQARSRTEAILRGGEGTYPPLTEKGRRANALVWPEER